MVKASNLRGRGGAGFPTGMKWSFLPKQTEKPVYLCVNADESEPGTFKDRADHRGRPAPAARGHHHLGLRHQVPHSPTSTSAARCALGYERAVGRGRARRTPKGYLGKNIFGTGFDLDVVVHRGAGAYICGEETGLHRVARGQARATRASSRRSPRRTASSAARRSSTTSRRSPASRTSSRAAPSGSRRIGPEKSPGPEALLRVAATWSARASTSCRWARRCARSSTTHAGGIPNGRKLKARHSRAARRCRSFTPDEIDVADGHGLRPEGGLVPRLAPASW